jgi:uncharacterized membrane protein YfcA
MKRSTASALALVFGLGLAMAAGPLWAADPTPAPSAAPVAAAPAPVPDTAKILTPQMPVQVKAAIEKSLADPQQAKKTQEAVAQGAQKRGERPGFLGIPGAPDPSLVFGFLWAVWVGWIFSTVGAFGGVMAGVGHMSVFGLGEYASTFGKGHPVNKFLTDSIRVSNQWLVGLSSIITSYNYHKMGRLVLPLALCLAVGSVAGAYLIPELTAGKVSFKQYQGWFGLCVLLLGCIIFYETTPKGQLSKKKAKEAADIFEQQRKQAGGASCKLETTQGAFGPFYLSLALVVLGAIIGSLGKGWFAGSNYVAYVLVGLGALLGLVVGFSERGRIAFCFGSIEFKFQAGIPVVGGLAIAALSAFLGVGGGFLYVPFLTSVAGLPMFLVAGTSALAVLVSMTTSIGSFMVGQGVGVEWGFIGMELVGVFVGSMIGPRTSKYIPDIWLKRLFVVLALYVGVGYFLRGFFDIRLPGV